MDGFNLYYRLKRISCKWLDVERLLNSVLGEKYDIINIKYLMSLGVVTLMGTKLFVPTHNQH